MMPTSPSPYHLLSAVYGLSAAGLLHLYAQPRQPTGHQQIRPQEDQDRLNLHLRAGDLQHPAGLVHLVLRDEAVLSADGVLRDLQPLQPGLPGGGHLRHGGVLHRVRPQELQIVVAALQQERERALHCEDDGEDGDRVVQ